MAGYETTATRLLRWIAWLLALIAAVATIALGWAAYFYADRQSELPSALGWLPSPLGWVPAALDPSSHFTAAVVLLLWALAFTAYALPRRREGRPFALLAIGGMAAVSLALGFASVARCTNNEDDILTPLWNAMVLFVGTTPSAFEADGVCQGPVPLAAQLARFGAMAAVFGSAIALALTFAVRQWDRIKARAIRHDELVIGANEASLPIIKTLLEWRDDLGKDANRRRINIAVLSLPGEEQTAQTVRDWGGRVHPIAIGTADRQVDDNAGAVPWRGDAASAGTAGSPPRANQTARSLRPFLTTRGRPAVTRVWILHDDLELVLAIEGSTKEVLDQTRGPALAGLRAALYSGITGHQAADTGAPDRPIARLVPSFIKKWLHNGAAPNREVRVVVLCEDRREAQYLRSMSITQAAPTSPVPSRGGAASAAPSPVRTSAPVEVISDPICPDEVSATEVIGRIAVTMGTELAASEAASDGYHLVLCGDTALADAMLQAVALRCWEQQRLDQAWRDFLADKRAQDAKRDAGSGGEQRGEAPTVEEASAEEPSREFTAEELAEAFTAGLDADDLLVGGATPTQVIVVSPSAEALIDQWQQSAAPDVRKAIRCQAVGRDWTELDRNHLPAGPLAVVLTEPIDLSRSHLTERLRLRLAPEIRGMWVLSRRIAKPCPVSFADHEFAFAGNVLLFGRLPEDYWTRIARLQHEVYRREHYEILDDKGAPNKKRFPWWHSDPAKRLPAGKRIDNLRQVRSFQQEVVDQGYRWRTSGPDDDHWAPDSALVEELAKIEHYRWNGANPEGDLARREGENEAQHRERLWIGAPEDGGTTEENRRKTRGLVRANFDLIQALGYIPVPAPEQADG